MSDTEHLHVSKPVAIAARRVEIFTGAGRRRQWSSEEKAAIVAESHGSGDTVCAVARRHGLTHSQLFAWRREARRVDTGTSETTSALFVPAIVASDSAGPSPKRPRKRRERKASNAAALIELEIDGVTVRVGRGAEAKIVAAVIRALKVDM
jgi:transposase